jgi:hypothetical protein
VQIHSRFLGPGATWDPSQEATPFRLRGSHPLCRAFQCPSTMTRLSDSLLDRQIQRRGPTTPHAQRLPALTRIRFGLIRFRSPLLTEYLFLPVLRCFTSRRSLHTPYIFRCGSPHMTVAGFPHSEILGSRFVCQLPEAYRRLQRPSSAPSAKASTLCPYKLDHKDHSKKMLASTVQFSSNDRHRHTHPRQPEPRPRKAKLPAVHETVTTRRPPPAGPPTGNPTRTRPQENNQPAVPSGPNSVPGPPIEVRRAPVPSPQQAASVLRSHPPHGEP